MSILKNSFSKAERICSDIEINLIYKTGTSFLQHPLVIYSIADPELKHSKVLVSVSKRKFKRAVDRNLLKRRIREAYRLNKTLLEKNYLLAFVYVGNDLLPYTKIEKQLVAGLQKLNNPEGTSAG